jgi:motility quorum-sensing regulator/GCU-specific mRNA interferase toxin
MTNGPRPTYDLYTVQELVGFGAYELSGVAATGMAELGLTVDDVEACICGMTSNDFHKSDPSEQRPELMLDIYRPNYDGQLIYVKIQVIGIVRPSLTGPKYQRRVNVVSFKEK